MTNLAARCRLQWINPIAATSESTARCHPRWWRETLHSAPGRWRGALWHVEAEVTSPSPLLFMPLFLVSSLPFFICLSSCCLFLKQPLYHLSGFSSSTLYCQYHPELLSCIGCSIIHLFTSFTIMLCCSKFQRKLGANPTQFYRYYQFWCFLITVFIVPYHIIESWKLPLVHYSLSFFHDAKLV